LDRTLETHQQRLMEQSNKSAEETIKLAQQIQAISQTLAETVKALETQSQRHAEQAALLQPLLDGEHQILRLQTSLQQNLQGLANTGAFHQAVHSLTAAIHLLTARVEPPRSVQPAAANPSRPGKAA
jgi:uncharacterized phage infection (PIP) family protein YhgE